jgi:hypothetical protein
MTSRSRPRLSAAARGYDHAHRKRVTAAKAAWRPGQPCARCGQPITSLTMTDRYGRTVSAVDLGHVDGSGKRLYQGLEHQSCSRRAGQQMTAAILRARRSGGQAWQWATSRRW